MSIYLRPKSFTLDKNGQDRTADTFEGTSRFLTRGAHEYEYERFHEHMNSLGLSAYRQELRELSFSRHIYYRSQHRLARSTVEKIIARRPQFAEPEMPAFERNKTMRNLIIAHGLTILKLELPPEKINLPRLKLQALKYFNKQKEIRKLQEEL